MDIWTILFLNFSTMNKNVFDLTSAVRGKMYKN